MFKKSIIALFSFLFLIVGLTACSSDADVVSKNLSKDAENFSVNRQIVFYNGITDTYIAEVNGLCSVESEEGILYVICKVGDDQYIKHFLGLSDNVTYFALQTDPKETSDSQYKVVFKPSTVVPDIDFR